MKIQWKRWERFWQEVARWIEHEIAREGHHRHHHHRHPHRLRRVTLRLHVLGVRMKGDCPMTLEVKLGATVVAELLGHSQANGALIPEGSTIALTSNDPTVATVPDTVAVPAGGSADIDGIPVTILASGATDIHQKTTTPDGSVFEDTATLLVDTVTIPGLVRVELVLHTPTV